MRTRAVLLIGISLVAISGNAVAQSASTAMPSSKTDAANAPTAQATAPRPSRPEIPASDRDIIVTAPLQQSETDVLQGTSVLKGEALTRDLRPSLGETLSRLPGVSATSFGPSASRPILRGFQGERSANNIFDVVARRHSSFLKDFAPLSGRDIRVSLRFGL